MGHRHGSGIFSGAADWIGTAEPGTDLGCTAYRVDAGDVYGSRNDRRNGELEKEIQFTRAIRKKARLASATS